MIQVSVRKGGNRKGAGRPKGGMNIKSAQIAIEAASKGITPIEVMLHVMRELFDRAQKSQSTEDFVLAGTAAKEAAPYVHPRMASIDIGNKDGQAFNIIVNKTAQ